MKNIEQDQQIKEGLKERTSCYKVVTCDAHDDIVVL